MQRRSGRHAPQQVDAQPTAATTAAAKSASGRRSQAAEATEQKQPTPVKGRKAASSASKASRSKRQQVSSEDEQDSDEEELEERELREERLPLQRVNAVPAHSASDARSPLEDRLAANASRNGHTMPSRTPLWHAAEEAVHAANGTVATAITADSSDDAASTGGEQEDLRSSSRFLLLRSLLMVSIFLLLFTLTQWYILEPIFQPHRTASYKRQQEATMKSKIAAAICPPGQECNYQLKEEYRV